MELSNWQYQYMVANYTTHDSELQSPTEITVRYQTKGWMVNELVTEWEDQGLFLKKLAMLVLNALTDISHQQ